MAEAKDTAAPKRRRKRRGRGRTETSLDGTNLFRDTRTGKLWWRKVNPLTGEREKESTDTDVLEFALKKAQQFEDELAKKVAGIKTYDSWTKPLAPLADEWFVDLRRQDKPPQERWLKQKERILARALKELGLKTAADLTDVGKIDRTLKTLGKPAASLRRRYQEPLCQFSAWLAENGRHLERDPLSVWKPIAYEREAIHRAFAPEGVARALVAAEWLDVIHHRQHPLRIAFELLLVTAPRVEVLCERDVAHYLRDERRVDYGTGVGKKLRGQGKLDEATAAAVEAYLGARTEGPLVLSPRGGRLDKRNLLRWWKEAYSLGVVWELWPEGEAWDVDVAHLVNQALLSKSGQARVPKHGNPDLVSVETRRARRAMADRVQALADAMRPTWAGRVQAVTVHSFRHTHQTWARAAGVDQVLVNLQVGWKASAQSSEFETARVAASTTGLKRYLDARSSLLDSRRSAEAVRALLDGAMAELSGATSVTSPLRQEA